MKKEKVLSILLATSILMTPMTSFAHSHRSHRRSPKKRHHTTATYYRCGGKAPHLHTNGCPYTKTNHRHNTNKRVQTKLNSLGHNCGRPDGVMGRNTKNAIKKFQRSKGLKADGVLGRATLKALGI